MVTEGFEGVEGENDSRRPGPPAEPFAPLPFFLTPCRRQAQGKPPPFLPSVVCRCALDRKKAGRQAGDKLNFGGALAPAARSISGTEMRGKFCLRGFSPGPWLALRSGQTRAWRYTTEATRGAEEIESGLLDS